VIAWLERRVPPIAATPAALFRIVFGAVLLAFFLTHGVDAGWIERAAPESAIHRLALPLFERAPQTAEWIAPWIGVWAVLFIAGAVTRLSFALLTLGAMAWSIVYTMRVGAHAVEGLVLAMMCLLAAPWSPVWGVDGWWRARRADPAPRRAYGYAIWILGFVLGTGFAAAAFAKIRLGGLGWITNGTVKYHFLTDSPDAPVDWGLRLAQYDGVAIILSFAAVAIEALVLVGACSTRYLPRLLAGIAALALLAGFALFQGLFWPAWWVLLLAFVPWHLVRHLVRLKPDTTYEGSTAYEESTTYEESTRRPASAGPADFGGLSRAQAVVIAAVVLQQVVASIARIELAPFVSAFDMYSSTYASPADYESKAGMSYWIAASFADGKNDSCRVSREDADAVVNREGARRARVLENCFDTAAPAVRTVSIEGSRRAVDWARWRLGDEVRVTLAGPMAID
jgi:hypothetical protein